MDWREIQNELRSIANEVTTLGQQIRTHSTDTSQMQLIVIKLRAVQQRLDVLVHIQGEDSF